MAELTAEDHALVLAALGATSRWLALMSTWLAEAGTEPKQRPWPPQPRRRSPPSAVGWSAGPAGAWQAVSTPLADQRCKHPHWTGH